MALPDVATWEARGRTVDVGGRRIFVVDEGTGPPIVVLHGYPTSSHDWAPILDRVRGRRMIVHDHLGFGLSDKPADGVYTLSAQTDLALGVWRALGVTSADVVAHDYGTSVATELLARREEGKLPFRIRTLTLSNGSVHQDLAKPRAVQWALASWAGPLVAKLSGKGLFARNLRATLKDASTLTDDEVDVQWTLLTRDGGRDRLPSLTQYLHERKRFRERWIGPLTRLDLPTHILWGRHDPVARPAVAEQLAAEIPLSRLTWLDCGHWPTIEAPSEWYQATETFLTQVTE